MKNLESHLINRIKTMLLNYDMNLIIGSNHDNLVFESTYLILCYNKGPGASGVYFWTNINDMLFSKDNIFYVLSKYFNFPKYICQCSSKSIEELIIKMDLLGI